MCPEPGPLVIKLSCSDQLKLKSILLINVKMPTMVEISTNFGYFSNYEHEHEYSVEHEKSFITLGPEGIIGNVILKGFIILM